MAVDALPEKVLSLARSVLEAAVMVMLDVPSKVVPLIVLPVWRAVAVPEFPVMERLMAVEVETEASVFTPVA